MITIFIFLDCMMFFMMLTANKKNTICISTALKYTSSPKHNLHIYPKCLNISVDHMLYSVCCRFSLLFSRSQMNLIKIKCTWHISGEIDVCLIFAFKYTGMLNVKTLTGIFYFKSYLSVSEPSAKIDASVLVRYQISISRFPLKECRRFLPNL